MPQLVRVVTVASTSLADRGRCARARADDGHVVSTRWVCSSFRSITNLRRGILDSSAESELRAWIHRRAAASVVVHEPCDVMSRHLSGTAGRRGSSRTCRRCCHGATFARRPSLPARSESALAASVFALPRAWRRLFVLTHCSCASCRAFVVTLRRRAIVGRLRPPFEFRTLARMHFARCPMRTRLRQHLRQHLRLRLPLRLHMRQR